MRSIPVALDDAATLIGANHGVIPTSLFRFMGPFGPQWEILSASATK